MLRCSARRTANDRTKLACFLEGTQVTHLGLGVGFQRCSIISAVAETSSSRKRPACLSFSTMKPHPASPQRARTRPSEAWRFNGILPLNSYSGNAPLMNLFLSKRGSPPPPLVLGFHNPMAHVCGRGVPRPYSRGRACPTRGPMKQRVAHGPDSPSSSDRSPLTSTTLVLHGFRLATCPRPANSHYLGAGLWRHPLKEGTR